jgi:hypothetical protein
VKNSFTNTDINYSAENVIPQNEISCTHEQAFHYPEVTLRKYGSPVKASEKEEEDNLDAVQDEAPVQQNDSNSALGNK